MRKIQLPIFALLFAVVFITTLAIVNINRQSASLGDKTTQWTQPIRLGPARALQVPAFVDLANETYVIWQSSPPDQTLWLSSINANGDPAPLLSYPDVNPQAWQVAGVDSSRMHLTWIENDGRLRSALIDYEGNTIRGPVTLAPRAEADFVLVGMAPEAFIVWRPSPEHPLQGLLLDSEGRPQPIALPQIQAAGKYAAIASPDRTLQIAWLEDITPLEHSVSLITGTPNTVATASPRTLTAMALDPGEYIQTFGLGHDETTVYLLWTVISASLPEVERVFTASTDTQTPSVPVRVQEISVPAHLSSLATPPRQSDKNLPITLYEMENSEETASIRWSNLNHSGSILAIAMSAKLDREWNPVICLLSNHQILGWQPISTLPADAGPVVPYWTDNGRLIIAWSNLYEASPHLYISSTS